MNDYEVGWRRALLEEMRAHEKTRNLALALAAMNAVSTCLLVLVLMGVIHA